MAERVFTRDVGRFKRGELRDYPMPVWRQIEKSSKMSMDQFSKEHDAALRDGSGVEQTQRSSLRRAK